MPPSRFYSTAGEFKLKFGANPHTSSYRMPRLGLFNSLCDTLKKPQPQPRWTFCRRPCSILMISNRKNPPSLKLHPRMPHMWTPSLFHQSPVLSLSPSTLPIFVALLPPRPIQGPTSTTDRTGRDRDQGSTQEGGRRADPRGRGVEVAGGCVPDAESVALAQPLPVSRQPTVAC